MKIKFVPYSSSFYLSLQLITSVGVVLTLDQAFKS